MEQKEPNYLLGLYRKVQGYFGFYWGV